MSNAVQTAPDAPGAKRLLGLAVRRGFTGRCPQCGKGRIFGAYLKVVDSCPVCGEVLHHQRADDAPPYLTMLIVGHFIVAGIVAFEEFTPQLPIWVGAIGWMLMTLVASLILLPRIKGALVGYQWALRMHGFGGPEFAGA
jgi:uncharacterized protein (DUF983 family)